MLTLEVLMVLWHDAGADVAHQPQPPAANGHVQSSPAAPNGSLAPHSCSSSAADSGKAVTSPAGLRTGVQCPSDLAMRPRFVIHWPCNLPLHPSVTLQPHQLALCFDSTCSAAPDSAVRLQRAARGGSAMARLARAVGRRLRGVDTGAAWT